jgi:hypothetical protein
MDHSVPSERGVTSSDRSSIEENRMSYLTTLATAVVLLFSAEIAYSQASRPQFRPGLDARGTSDDQKACGGDARRHCRDVLSQGDFAVLGCLRENRSKLSERCRAVLTRHGQ